MTIEFQELTVAYGQTIAVDRLSLTLASGKIYGLLGRNGAGKTSLLSALAAFRRPSGGRILVNGVEPFENADVVRDIAFIRQGVDATQSDKVRDVLSLAARLRPRWDDAYARRLIDRFELPVKKSMTSLSTGMRSALGVVVGLAARAPLTIFDESHLGLDAPTRYAFYDELLADYAEQPRTVILSTHLIEEVARLFEEVVIIDRGRLVLHEETDAVRARGVAITGPAATVGGLVNTAVNRGATVLATQTLGPTTSVTLFGQLDHDLADAGRADGLELGPVGLQDLFVHLTATAPGAARKESLA